MPLEAHQKKYVSPYSHGNQNDLPSSYSLSLSPYSLPLPSHLLQEGQGQHAPPLDVVRVLHTHQTGARVVRVRVAVADLGLQLVQVKGAIGEVGHSGGVNPSKLWGGHERAE